MIDHRYVSISLGLRLEKERRPEVVSAFHLLLYLPTSGIMDVLSEAPSCDPEIQPDLLKIREFVSPAYPTLAVPVDSEPRLAADVATTSSCTSNSYGEFPWREARGLCFWLRIYREFVESNLC